MVKKSTCLSPLLLSQAILDANVPVPPETQGLKQHMKLEAMPDIMFDI